MASNKTHRAAAIETLNRVFADICPEGLFPPDYEPDNSPTLIDLFNRATPAQRKRLINPTIEIMRNRRD